MLTVEDWAEIRRLHRGEGMPIKAIARQMGISKNTVRRALTSHEPPHYQRASRGSIVDAVEPQIRELLEQWPTMPTTVIAERIGWDRSITVLKDRVRVLRPLFTPPDPVSRTLYQPGELAQCDLWFPPADIPLGYGQGPPGTGKTHLAIGLAIRACQAGHRVAFATAAEWVTRLAEAHHAGRLAGELVRLGRYPLIVVDLCRHRNYAECCVRGRGCGADGRLFCSA